MNKSAEEYQMDTLEKNFINGLITQKEYDQEMGYLMESLNSNKPYDDSLYEVAYEQGSYSDWYE